MRARILLIPLMAGINASAQVVFDLPTAMPLPTSHDEQWFAWNNIPVSIATTGTNVIWDLSGALVPTFTFTTIESAPAGGAGASYFPNATHAHGEVIGTDSTWHYFRLDAFDTLWYEGTFSTAYLFTCSTPNLYMVFPYSIGDLVESNASCEYNGFPMTSNQGMQPVATGTILYPGGMIPDVVLVQFYYGGVAASEYYWFRMDNVLRYIGSYTPGAILTVAADISTGFARSEGPVRIQAYPVPSANTVFVDMEPDTGPVAYALLESAGRVISSGLLHPSGGRIRVDVSDLPTGHYLLRLEEGRAVRFARVSVVR